jgi:hypothetical protein
LILLTLLSYFFHFSFTLLSYFSFSLTKLSFFVTSNAKTPTDEAVASPPDSFEDNRCNKLTRLAKLTPIVQVCCSLFYPSVRREVGTTIMFQRFRSRRSNQSKLSKVERDRSNIFRHKKNDVGRPLVLYPTFSVDSEEAGSVSTASHSAFEMDNDLCSHVPAIIETERSQQKRQLQELMEAHAEEIADKDEEIVRCTTLLQETERKLAEVVDAAQKKDETITDLQEKLMETEAILNSTQAELCESKANLKLICSELIQTQHVLHEKEQQLNIFAELGKGIYHYFSAAA